MKRTKWWKTLFQAVRIKKQKENFTYLQKLEKTLPQVKIDSDE